MNKFSGGAEIRVDAYNRDNSDIQVDYFDVRFYSHVRFEQLPGRTVT